MNAYTEISIMSGKGGTGKTTVSAGLATLAGNPVIADCDVDAPDLHIVLAPSVLREEEFTSGYEAVINEIACTGCGACVEACAFDAVALNAGDRGRKAHIDPFACEGCGVCVRFCRPNAIELRDSNCGTLYVSMSRFGPFIHARMRPGAENSGKLVTAVREFARMSVENMSTPMIIADGPPGIGCTAIATITGATYVLVVSEPTRSGIHDMERILSLCAHFGVPCGVCISKYDLSRSASMDIEKTAEKHGVAVVGRLRYSADASRAQAVRQSVVEFGGGLAADIENLWDSMLPELGIAEVRALQND